MPDVDGILDRLLLFLGYEKDYVTAETLIQVGRWGYRRVRLEMWGGLLQAGDCAQEYCHCCCAGLGMTKTQGLPGTHLLADCCCARR